MQQPLEHAVSPAGIPEVSPDFLRRHGCSLHVVDIREEHELTSEIGHIPGAEWVPLSELHRAAETWDRSQLIVLVDRSGRRSGAAALELADRGFERVASLTGGMLAYKQAGYPTSRSLDNLGRLPEAKPVERPGQPLTADQIEAHIGPPEEVHWTKAGTWLLHGAESCVDGRDAHAVIGTPGGDAGELLVALATVEALTGRTLSEQDVERLFSIYLEAFGHFYMHTDDHALEALAEALREEGWDLEGGSVEDVLRHPPAERREALLERLIEPSAIGCGHLRLVSLHPDEYGVRPGLVKAMFRAFFTRLWSGAPEIDYVVLHGDHAEGAVVNVALDHDVHAFSRIPMVAPRHRGSEIFVNHPQVAAFVRRQNAAFLYEQLASLRGEVDKSRFLDALQDLADRQLAATVDHLAARLPIFEARFETADGEVAPGPTNLRLAVRKLR